MSPTRFMRCSGPPRIFLCIWLTFPLAGCPRTRATADAGRLDAAVENTAPEAGFDAGVEDAGSIDAVDPDGASLGTDVADAGAVDVDDPDAWLDHSGGLDAGRDEEFSQLTLSVAGNQNSVLSAVATVSWTNSLSSVSVTVTTGSTTQSTPPVGALNVSGPVTIPIVPLKANTTYTLVASGTDAFGATFASNSVVFSTGAIPSQVPFFSVADGGVPSPGYTLVARLPPTGISFTDYLTITDGTGAPVWYYPAVPKLGGDFQQQPDGTFTVAVVDPTHSIPGLGESITVFRQIDILGNTLATWSALDVPDAVPPITVAATDDHDIRIQPNGDALLFGYVLQTMDLAAYGGSAEANVVADVLERVTPGGAVSFCWDSFSYLDIANIDPAVVSLAGSVVDFTHANSIDVMADGSYLVSLRNLSQVLKIDSSTGEVLWKLGGKDGNFVVLNDALGGFSGQHAARELPNGDIILFDDGDGHTPPQSRAVEYQLDTNAMTATLVWSAEDTPPLYSYVLGNAQRLPNGNTLVTYGTTLHVQEVDPSGAVLWDMFDPTKSYGLYRAYRLDTLSSLALLGD